jgi:plastocyanin
VKRLRRIALVTLVVGAASALAVLPGAAQTTGKTVKVGDNYFKPKSLSLVVGDRLTFKWVGSARHDVKVKKGPQKFDSKLKSSGKFSRTIKSPGKYVIYCTIHPGMEMKLKAKAAPPTTTTLTPAT